MARRATRSAKAAKAKKSPARPKRESRLFALKLHDIPLTEDQAQRIASQIRDVTTKELLRMDFLIQELKAPPKGKIVADGCQGCG
jgi:hypothetical protein